MKATTNKVLENNPIWIADVGAAGGVDPKWEKFTSFYKGILFEPDPREYESLRAKSSDNLVVLNSVLADSACELDFYLCKRQQVSSVYTPDVEFLKQFLDVDRFNVVKQMKMQADTFDNVLRKSGISEVDFIKLDTQGSELPILKGAMSYLENVIGLEIEVEFAQLYRNQPLFGDVDRFAREQGFDLFDIKRTYWKRKDSKFTGSQKGQLIYGDALYFRAPESVLLMKGISQEKITRAICVYLVYGYLDLAQSLSSLAREREFLTKNVRDRIDLLLSLYERRNVLPDFRGKARLQDLLERMANALVGGWSSGTDKSLGNS